MFFQKIQNITIQNLHFIQMFTIVTTIGTPSMITFKMKVVTMNLI
jgi:hypothetical protein